MADVPGKFYRATKVRTGVSPSSAGSIEGEPLPPVNPPGSSLNSVGLTMPSAFTVSNSPLTANGTIGVAGAGTVSQYIRGDGSLADFPESSGGGGSVSYYLNGSVNQGTIGGVAYKELNKVPILGAGTDFTINADGYIASFITDAGDPNLLEIPGGNWNFETYFSSSSSGGTPTFYVELYKYDGTTFTLIASSVTSPEFIAFGTTLTPYFSTLAVPTTTLALTDRLAIRYYVTHSGRTITLHTENNHLCQIITTFTTGLTALNGLTAQVQNFAVGTTGTDFNIASAVSTHTFNLPTASATNRGALSSADWALFTQAYNDKINSASVTGTTTKTLTLTQQDGGTITASWSDLNTDAVLSVFGRTGSVVAVSGDYTTAQVTESGNLYYTDARSRAALSFAAGSGAYNTSTGVITIPTNNNQITNGAGYITSAALAGYLPLSGGVMTGPITTPNGTFGIVIGDDSRLADRNIANTLFLEGAQNNDRGYINFSQTTGNALGAINGGDLTWRGNTVLTGSASAGQVAYWSSGSAITGESNLFWDATNDRLGIGTNTPQTGLHLFSTSPNIIIQNSATSSVGNISRLFYRALLSSGNTAFIGFIDGVLDSTIQNTGHLEFYTYNNGITDEGMRIFSGGNVHIGPSPSSNNGARLQVSGNATFSGAYGTSSGVYLSGTTYGVYGANRGASSASAGMNYFTVGSQRWFAGIYENSDNFGIYSVGTGGFPLVINYSTGNLEISATSDITFGGSGKGIFLSRAGLGPRASLTTRAGITYVDIANSSDWSGVTLAASGGSVLIGTTSDNGARLQVSGTATFSSTVQTGGNVRVPAGSGIAFVGDASRIMTPEDNVQGAKIATPGGFLVEASLFKFIGGNVGIGTPSPAALTEINPGNITNGGAAKFALAIRSGGTTYLDFYQGYNSTIAGQSILGTTLVSSDALAFATSGTEKMRITSAGRVLIGNPPPAESVYTLDVVGGARFTNSTRIDNGTLIITDINTPQQSILLNDIATNGNTFALLSFGGRWNSTTYGSGSQIRATSVGTWSSTNYGTNLSFATVAQNSTTMTERMRVTSGGDVIVGFNQNTLKTIGRTFTTNHVSGNRGAALFYGIADGSNGGMFVYNVASTNPSFNAQYITFETHQGGISAGERMRINADGNVGIGATNVTGRLVISADDSQYVLRSQNASAGFPNQFYIQHNLGNVIIGNDRGTVTYGNPSDYRLKEDLKDYDA